MMMMMMMMTMMMMMMMTTDRGRLARLNKQKILVAGSRKLDSFSFEVHVHLSFDRNCKEYRPGDIIVGKLAIFEPFLQIMIENLTSATPLRSGSGEKACAQLCIKESTWGLSCIVMLLLLCYCFGYFMYH